jgi:hypothetical protein
MPLHTLLYSVCDPCTILFERSADADATTGLPPRVQQPIVDWFDPGKSATANPATDWLIEIYNGRYVSVIYGCNAKNGPAIFGDLRQEGARFVAWLPYPRRGPFRGGAIAEIAHKLFPERFVDFVAEWEDPIKWPKELKALNYEFENHDSGSDPLCVAAQAALCSPLFRTTVNITLALRKALRRYLGIEPTAPVSEMGD